jgi:hypothetical protein
MDRLREILSAASFLSANISSIDAQRLSSDHRKELQLAFDGLKRTLQPRISCETSSPNKCLQSSEIVLSALSCRQQQERPTTSLTETSQEASDTHSVQALITSPPSAVARFMEKLQNHSEEIHRFASANAKLPDLQNDDWTTEKDPRMVYIAISGRNATPLQRFQGWLSRYSCAQDYRTWAAEHKYAPSDLLNLSLKDADNRRAGHVAEYLSFIGRQDDRGFREAIQYGLKCMSFEGIYNDPGVCAVICLMFTSFRDLPYKYLNSLAQEIRKSQEWSTFIQGKAKWLSDCQAWLRDCCGKFKGQLM